MTVNQEIENITNGLEGAVRILASAGQLAVISYHSLEDRLVKRFLKLESSDCICPPTTPLCVCGHTARMSLVSRRVIKPSAQELEANPRSRSARLRVAERI